MAHCCSPSSVNDRVEFIIGGPTTAIAPFFFKSPHSNHLDKTLLKYHNDGEPCEQAFMNKIGLKLTRMIQVKRDLYVFSEWPMKLAVRRYTDLDSDRTVKCQTHALSELKVRWFALANYNNKTIFLTGGSDFSK